MPFDGNDVKTAWAVVFNRPGQRVARMALVYPRASSSLAGAVLMLIRTAMTRGSEHGMGCMRYVDPTPDS